VFSRARKSNLITNHVFVASALMEYYVNKDPVVAGKIFELGMKTFPLNEDEGSTEYILRYLDFLMCLNDDNNTRALFERSLAAIQVARSKPVWQKYIDYETQYGDISNFYRIEKRWHETFPLGLV
jgi:cleavage stimulation factor subunit 3